MPKASFDSSEMYSPSRGFVETVGTRKLGEVVAACSRYIQWQANKKTGVQTAPLTSVFLTIQEIDASGNPIAEPVEQELVAEWGPKDESLIRVRPGIAGSRDAEPQDTAENGVLVLGTEGDCLFVDEGVNLNKTNAFGFFADSCKQKGFKPQILGAGFLPDFVRMRAWFTLRAGKKKDDGTTFNDFVVDEIVRFPYEQAAATTAQAAGKAKPGPKPKATPAPAAATPAPAVNGAAAAATGDVAEIALGLLKSVSADIEAKGGMTGVTRQKLTAMSLQKMLAPSSGIDKSKHQSIQAQLKDQIWFESVAGDAGLVNDGVDTYMTV